MKRQSRTNQELFEENSTLKQRIRELEQLELECTLAKEMLSESEANLKESQGIATLGSWFYYLTGQLLWSDEMYRIYGVSRETFTPDVESFISLIHPEDRSAMQGWINACIAGENPSELEFRTILPDGTVRIVSGRGKLIPGDRHRPIHISGTAQDITERKLLEKSLRKSEHLSAESQTAAFIGSYITDFKTGLWESSAILDQIFGIDQHYNKNIQGWLEIVHPADKETMDLYLKKEVISRRKPFNKEYRIIRKSDGEIRWVNGLGKASFDGEGNIISLIGTIQDITDRKRVTDALLEAEEQYRNLFENTKEGIIRSTPEGRIIRVNQALAEMAGYESVQAFMAKVTDVAHQLYVYPEEREKVKELIERQGYVKGFEVRWHKKNGNIIWVSSTMHPVRDQDGKIIYYESINEDITERKLSVERLRKVLVDMVQAIAITVELRDPYTAGHQRRVANLAQSIAMEMGLKTDEAEGIYMASVIHDIGKISVPAEILSKPTKLKKAEFDLIKDHCLSGYEILKDIDFSWPLAEIVNQHHEKMNGSGYPRNLQGEEILMESRILTVADVVEAMASHRPYRPALGIDVAMNEIETNRGICYDNAVVDACLKLFRQKGFQLAGT